MDIKKILKHAAHSQVRGYALRVLIYMLSSELYDDKENTISITQKDIARNLNIEQCMANKSIAELRNSNIISVSKRGNRNVYKFLF